MSTQIDLRLVCFTVLALGFLLVTGVSLSRDAQAAPGLRSIDSVCDWEQLRWSDMTRREQRRWTRLGWVQLNWDSDWYKPPVSEVD